LPLGAIGMSVFSIDLYFASRGLPASGLLTLSQFLAQAPHWRVLADLLLKTHPVPVVPVALINLWGSFFPAHRTWHRDAQTLPPQPYQRRHPGGRCRFAGRAGDAAGPA